jgi:hypothetical protein
MFVCLACGAPGSAVTEAGKCLDCCDKAIAEWREWRRLHPPKAKAKKKGLPA